MKRFFTRTLVMCALILPGLAYANNVKPTAVITNYPNSTTHRPIDDITFYGTSSYDGDNSDIITYYWWRVQYGGSGSYYSLGQGSSKTSITVCFDPDAPKNTLTGMGCRGTGGATEFTIRLQVRDNENSTDYEYKTFSLDYHGRRYFIKDHLGSVRTTVNEYGKAIGYDDYYPFGLVLDGRSSNAAPEKVKYRFTGYEQEEELDLDLLFAGARMYDPILGRFMSIDRFYEKYPNLTPYQYAANNPIYFVDVNGDSLWINQGKNRYLYKDGSLYNEDGSAYTGKVRGFLKRTVKALNKINSTESGAEVVSSLQASDNNFDIMKGSNRFEPSNTKGSVGAIHQLNGIDAEVGSGGTIYWDPSYEGTLELGSSGLVSRPAMMLAHELFHGYESDQGMLDNRVVNDLPRAEWRATYFENQVRNDLGIPYRTYYRRTNLGEGLPPRLLDSSDKPIHVLPAVVNMKIIMPKLKYSY